MAGFILTVLACAAVSLPAFAGDETPASVPKTYTVSAEDLTPDQIAKLEADKAIKAVETVGATVQAAGKYTGVGREIGEGVSGALSALNEETQKFGDSKVGQFTMAMIAWKIMGDDILATSQDVIGYMVGVPYMFLGCMAVLWSYYARCMPRRVCVEKGQGFFPSKRYEVVKPPEESTLDPMGLLIAHGLAFAFVVGTGSMMLFAQSSSAPPH